jgi:hypothetical protein
VGEVAVLCHLLRVLLRSVRQRRAQAQPGETVPRAERIDVCEKASVERGEPRRRRRRRRACPGHGDGADERSGSEEREATSDRRRSTIGSP